MATLYTHKAENIRRTWLLLGAFVGLIALLGWIFSYALDSYAIFPISVAFAALSALLSYWFSDRMVVALTRAKPLAKEDDPDLYRIVENLSIAAGLPMPKLYAVVDEAPNAFATGRDPKHAVVAVTTGLRKRLDKQELGGVLAHELAHVGNRDMRVAAIAAVLAGVIIVLADLFMRMLVFGGGNRDRHGGGPLIAVGIIGAIVLAPIAATLLRLAISRRREFLADATGALITRYPEGLARALEKISTAPVEMRRASDATAHLWFSDPKPKQHRRSRIFALFLTHPPVENRIRALRDMAP